MAYKNYKGVAISNNEAVLEQMAGRAVMDATNGLASITDVSATVTKHSDKNIRSSLSSGRTEN